MSAPTQHQFIGSSLAGARLVTSWTNGRKALVDLLEMSSGERVIRKTYRRGFVVPMFREYLATRYVAARMPDTPRVLAFEPRGKSLFLSYVPGQRVLEWVLERFGDPDLRLDDFQSCHGVDQDRPDPRVATAFERFRLSASRESNQLKQAIRSAYEELHRQRFVHGSADPRNVIYHEGRVAIIDFDHARPCLNPAKLDYAGLNYWFGLDRLAAKSEDFHDEIDSVR